MIAKLLELLHLIPPQPMLPAEDTCPRQAADWETGQTIDRANRQIHRVEIHTDQARRIIRSWDDLLLPGGK